MEAWISAEGSDTGELSGIEPAVRRVVSARVREPSDVDDLVQETLVRVMRAGSRLPRDAVLPFAVVTARNLVISDARRRSRAVRLLPRLFERRSPVEPADALVEAESLEALRSALGELSPAEREMVAGSWNRRPPRGRAQTGAERARAARVRSRLRVEYLLALRRVDLPSPQCKPVLMAISAGDGRRQRALDVPGHLTACPTCAALSEPLRRRSLPMAALAFPLVVLRWLGGKARSHPVPAATGGAAIAAAASVGAVLALHHPAPARAPSAAGAARPIVAPVTPSPLVVPNLVADGQGLPPTSALASFASAQATATGVRVQSVVTHDGFWVGSGAADRVWVELVGPLRSMQILAGEALDFTGTVVFNGPGFASTAGVAAGDGAALLTAEGAHIDVTTSSVTVVAPQR